MPSDKFQLTDDLFEQLLAAGDDPERVAELCGIGPLELQDAAQVALGEWKEPLVHLLEEMTPILHQSRRWEWQVWSVLEQARLWEDMPVLAREAYQGSASPGPGPGTAVDAVRRVISAMPPTRETQRALARTRIAGSMSEAPRLVDYLEDEEDVGS